MPRLLYVTKQKFGMDRVARPMHKHDIICELLLVYRGFGTYIVNSRAQPIEEGDILYYNAGDLHEVTSDNKTEIGTYCFGFTDLHLEGLPENCLLLPGSDFVRPASALYPTFNNLCALIYEQMSENSAQSSLVGQLLSAALLLLSQQLSPAYGPNLAPEEYTLSHRVKKYIDQHYTEYLTLDLIAQALGCSPYYLSHSFKKAMGYSPIQYVIRRRIGEAQTLLINSDYSATQIATMVGYDNTNYFCTLFMRIVGLSPIRYRRQYLDQMKGERTQ